MIGTHLKFVGVLTIYEKHRRMQSYKRVSYSSVLQPAARLSTVVSKHRRVT